MHKMFTIFMTFVAISVVIAVFTYKYLTERQHVQDAGINITATTEAESKSAAEDAAQDLNVKFSLSDETGNSFSEKSLEGKISIVNFVFRSCKTVCPFLMSKTRSLAAELDDHYDYLRVISITVDPTNDTQEVLRQWQKEVAINQLEWKFLRGDRDSVFTIVKEQFKQSVMDNAENMDMPIAHSSYLALVNENGTIAGFFDSNDTFQMKALKEKAAELAANLKKTTKTSVNH